NEMAWNISLGAYVSKKEQEGMSLGHRTYTVNCIACHGSDRQGNPNSGFPYLLGIEKQRNKGEVGDVIAHGLGMMPSFSKLSKEERTALVDFLFDAEGPASQPKHEAGDETLQEAPRSPYRISGYTKFLDSKGLPAISPPWGTLNAIDLNTGEYLWKIPYGEYPELTARGIPPTGSESYGGPVVTASGLLFIAGTKDEKFRVYDKNNGQLLWETVLPAAAFATPSTYEVNGKQYIVMACGGTKLGASGGDSYIAFALPEGE